MDISAASAYDNVNIDILCDRLATIKCSTKVIKTIHNLFAKSTIVFYEENCLVDGFKGLAKGSTLSPLLFNVYTSNIGFSIPSHIKLLQYADDIVIYTAVQDNKLIQDDIQAAITILDRQYDCLDGDRHFAIEV